MPKSAIPCGCDEGIGWVCEQHQQAAAPTDPFPYCDCGACQMRRALIELEQLKRSAK